VAAAPLAACITSNAEHNTAATIGGSDEGPVGTSAHAR
jgi:hypothetical protein